MTGRGISILMTAATSGTKETIQYSRCLKAADSNNSDSPGARRGGNGGNRRLLELGVGSHFTDRLLIFLAINHVLLGNGQNVINKPVQDQA